MQRRSFLQALAAAVVAPLAACVPNLAPAALVGKRCVRCFEPAHYHRIAQYHNVEHWMTPSGDVWVARHQPDFPSKIAAVEVAERYVYGTLAYTT